MRARTVAILSRMDVSLRALTEERLQVGYRERTGSIASIARATDYDALRKRCACVTLLAGSGSRWVSSLREAASSGSPSGFDERAPRGLYPVRNVMDIPGATVPIAAYALRAARGLGKTVLVVRGWEREIEEGILRPLGYAPGSWVFRTQAVRDGKPRGHGDAAFQCMDSWRDREFVLFNFGGDASNPFTARAALAVLAALDADKPSGAPGLLMPVARVEGAAYPVSVDERGLPRSFGHAKLKAAGLASGGPSYTNVGLRLYRSSELAVAIEAIRREFWTPERGYAIPGNDPEGGEFALDNVDEYLAQRGKARLLHIARPEELSPVKSLGDIARFEKDMEAVWKDASILP